MEEHMNLGRKSTALTIRLLGLIVLTILTGCGGEATPIPESEAEAYVSTYLDTAYQGALPAANQLILGTLLLEETTEAITPAQAATLLPLWQALQGGSLQGQTEVNAVLGQIERAMTPEQLSAITAMQLTREDLTVWLEEQGFDLPRGPAGEGGDGPENLSPETRETMRAGFESMTDEERAERRATAEAGGMTMPEGGGGFGPNRGQGGGGQAGMGQFGFVLQPLLDLLTQRAGQ
jgi:hypothetical protein